MVLDRNSYPFLYGGLDAYRMEDIIIRRPMSSKAFREKYCDKEDDYFGVIIPVRLQDLASMSVQAFKAYSVRSILLDGHVEDASYIPVGVDGDDVLVAMYAVLC